MFCLFRFSSGTAQIAIGREGDRGRFLLIHVVLFSLFSQCLAYFIIPFPNPLPTKRVTFTLLFLTTNFEGKHRINAMEHSRTCYFGFSLILDQGAING